MLKSAREQAGSPGTTASTQSPPTLDDLDDTGHSCCNHVAVPGSGPRPSRSASSNYTVVIATFNSCWVEAQIPGTVNPLINRTLTAGPDGQHPGDGGQLNVELGVSGGRHHGSGRRQTVTGWSLRPDAVPFRGHFTDN